MKEEYGKVWRYPVERQHVVNNPIIFNKDIDIQRRMFWEAAQSTGIIVEFYNCLYDDSDFNNDPNCLWEDKIILPIIFDDHPKVKVIKELGWYTEDDERPMLAYLPMYKDWTTKELLHLRENSLIRVFYYGNDMPAEFRITDKKMDSLYGVHWVCKLTLKSPKFSNFFLYFFSNPTDIASSNLPLFVITSVSVDMGLTYLDEYQLEDVADELVIGLSFDNESLKPEVAIRELSKTIKAFKGFKIMFDKGYGDFTVTANTQKDIETLLDGLSKEGCNIKNFYKIVDSEEIRNDLRDTYSEYEEDRKYLEREYWRNAL